VKSRTLTCIIAMILFAATAIGSPAQSITLKTLVSFNNRANPQGEWNSGNSNLTPLVQGRDGNLWGTTEAGGAEEGPCNGASGTIFRMIPSGKLTTLHVFHGSCSDGQYPESGMVLGTDGSFYGTTVQGGGLSDVSGCSGSPTGTIFRITQAGDYSILHTFPTNCSQGIEPVATLVQGTDGNFYGATTAGGAHGCGTVFRITPSGVLTKLYSFPAVPYCDNPFGTLVQGTDGNFYGTTRGGGKFGEGTVYRITPEGSYTLLHSFTASTIIPYDGQYPNAGLVQGTDGNFYGATELGGANDGGTVFRITPSGKETILYSLGGTASPGSWVDAPLIQATDGNFYGVTVRGEGSCFDGCGTIFKITPAGKLTTLYSFHGHDGSHPTGGLVQYTDGSFYGMTSQGGSGYSPTQCGSTDGCGTVYRMVVSGLGPFVRTVPTSGKVGSIISILGNNLTDATSVKFNGKAAKFVPSSTDIAATVPAGATTGTVTVVTPTRTLSSNVKFRVTP
jgi:uncharacterized repeat protein (TIGR03803 family)